MALEEYAGSIVMEIDGVEVDIESLDTTNKTGRKLVKTMNRTGRAKGFSKGIAEFDLKVSAVIPLTGTIDWANIEGAKITIYPLDSADKRTSYSDCFTMDVGEKYSVDNEARVDITMGALRRELE